MTSTNSTSTELLPSPAAAAVVVEDITVKAVNKRYEGLVTVRTKALKGKGAWYWAHLEPILIRNADSGLPKSVKLKCSLCNSVFSASNLSRTASEHLKRGTCPNLSSSLRPNSSILPMPIFTVALPNSNNHSKKRSSTHMDVTSPYQNHLLALVESSQFCSELGYSPTQLNMGINQQHLILSGGKEDLSIEE